MADETRLPNDRNTTRNIPTAPDSPERIGPYRVLQQIGEGGMGVVYLTEQQKPIRRRVALKLIKLGMDTKAVIGRFEAERQALALMNHPNIARVFDAGATEQGRPYFVMEYVQGVPITEHCDRHRLTTKERLELFVQVCEGVQHAHQKGVIHRDIKPSNVLVQIERESRIPKIIDFGVAKATQQRLTERTLFTELGLLIGTPEYMSPEQAELTVEDIDTRTDVYSLGVLLYELLVGALPFDLRELREGGFDEIRRMIREDEPSKPSARLRTLGDASVESAQRRGTDLRTLKRILSGDLDWITMKTLEKDRVRRYATPGELAADLKRFFASSPVLARPPSRLYRLRKFARRNRTPLAATAVALTAVAFGLGIWGRSYVRNRIGHRYFHEAVDAPERVAEYIRASGNSLDTPMSDVLRELSDYAHSNLSPVVAYNFHRVIREVYEVFGDWPAAGREQERMVEISRDQSSAAYFKYDVFLLVDYYRKAGMLDEAEQLLGESTELFHDDCAWHDLRARVLAEKGPTDEANQMSDRALAFNVCSSSDREHLLFALQVLGRHDDAQSIIAEAITDEPNSPFWYERRGISYREQGRLEDAAADFEKAFALAPDGRGRINRAFAPSALGGIYERLGRLDDAIDVYRAAVEIDPSNQWAPRNLASALRKRGRIEEAEAVYRAALDRQTRVYGAWSETTLETLRRLAALYEEVDRQDDAYSLYEQSYQHAKATLGPDDPETFAAKRRLARVCERQHHWKEAERLYMEVLTDRRRVLGHDHDDTLESIHDLGLLLREHGRGGEAEPLYVEHLATQRRVRGDGHPETLISMRNLASLYRKLERYDEAESLFDEALTTARRELGSEHARTLALLGDLAYFYSRRRQIDEAEPLYREKLRIERAKHGDDDSRSLTTMSNLGGLCVKASRLVEAQQLLNESYAGHVRLFGEEDSRLKWSHYYLGLLAAARGEREEALDRLREAVDLGWVSEDILDDSPLDPLRGDPEFEELVTTVRTRLEAD